MCPEQCLAPMGHARCSGARPFSLGGGKGRCSSLQGWIDTQPSSMGRSPVSYSSPVPKPRLWAPLQQGKGLSHRNGQGRLLQKHCSDTAGLGSCPAISCCPSLCSLPPQPSSLCSQDGCHRSRPHIHTPPHAGKRALLLRLARPAQMAQLPHSGGAVVARGRGTGCTKAGPPS